ncbi:hypothetical protein [Yoonia sp. SDW83-1]|uniref:hypothetical protein n=1 Tax=Yoonia sp. SDW83-1 TaxID=3366945 RepID=UPI00398C4D36
MLTMAQATDILADVFGADRGRLRGVAKRLRGAGMLPVAKGRDIPQANPGRMALMVIGLGISDPERIGELADMRVFDQVPGDSDQTITLQQTLGFMMSGLLDHPGQGIDASLTLTVDGPSLGFIQRKGETWMQFCAGDLAKGYINTTTHIALQPLTDFCTRARVTQPPYKVT